MAVQLRLILIIVSFLTFIFLIRTIQKSKMKIEDAVFWIFISFSFILMSLFPRLMKIVSFWMGVESTVNLIYLIILFLLLLKLFFQTIKISQLEFKITNLAQEIAILHKKEVEKANVDNKIIR